MATALKIKAKRNGFRRAGYGFSDTEETIIPVKDLTKAQQEELKAEPNLLVSEIEIKEDGGKKGSDPKDANGEGDSEAGGEQGTPPAGRTAGKPKTNQATQ